MTKVESSSDENGRKSQRTWLDSGANTTLVWERSEMSSYVTVSDSFAEICEGQSKIIGKGDVKLYLGSKPFSVRAKNTPKFNEISS